MLGGWGAAATQSENNTIFPWFPDRLMLSLLSPLLLWLTLPLLLLSLEMKNNPCIRPVIWTHSKFAVSFSFFFHFPSASAAHLHRVRKWKSERQLIHADKQTDQQTRPKHDPPGESDYSCGLFIYLCPDGKKTHLLRKTSQWSSEKRCGADVRASGIDHSFGWLH